MVYARKQKDGTTMWYMSFPSIPTGRRIRRRASANKRVAMQMENAERLKWDQYQAGLYNPQVDAVERPLKEHVLDFLNAVELGRAGGGRRGKPGEKHVDVTTKRLRTIVHDRGWNSLGDLTHESLLAFLDKLEAGQVKDPSGRQLRGRESGSTKVSAKTRDDYGKTAVQFGKWLEMEERVQRNPFHRFRAVKVNGRDETVTYRALSLEEVQRIAEAAPQRACLYYLAATTGLRVQELRNLRWSDVHLNDDVPHIALPGFRNQQRQTKNGKDATIPLQPWVSDLLLAHRKDRLGKREVFLIGHNTASLIRQDAEIAGVPVFDDQGRKLVFHSLRSSAATILFELGVHPDVVQQVLRHSDIKTTIDHYRKFDLKRLAAAMCVIPDPRRKQG